MLFWCCSFYIVLKATLKEQPGWFSKLINTVIKLDNIGSEFVYTDSVVWACFILLLCMLVTQFCVPKCSRGNILLYKVKLWKWKKTCLYAIFKFMEIWSIWEVKRALNKLLLLSDLCLVAWRIFVRLLCASCLNEVMLTESNVKNETVSKLKPVWYVVLIGKGDPYVKLTVDGKQPSKKTEAVRKTWEPKWDDEFTVWVIIHINKLF